MSKAINIVIEDCKDSKYDPYVFFVDIETDSGKSIRIGEWEKLEESNFYKLRITSEDIENIKEV